MTVSLALRRHPSIPTATRERIQEVARIQGYRPDPSIAKLMQHLGTRRPLRHRANLCALTPVDPPMRPQGYLDRLLGSLKRRAESLGYSFSVVEMDGPTSSPARLRRLLRGRGVEGIVLTPMPEPRDLADALAWDEFSVVSVTPSVVRPSFHIVSPNHFDNMLRACRALKAAGFSRIGLALPEDRDQRVRNRWTGALAWHYMFGGGAAMPALIDSTSATSLDPQTLDRWMAEHRPDAIVTDFVERQVAAAAAQAGRAGPRPRVVAMSWPNPFADAGIDQRVEEIGSFAIERLAGLIQHGEKGIPRSPSTTMVDGDWTVAAENQFLTTSLSAV
jgi:LacI family transcriptional regulator